MKRSLVTARQYASQFECTLEFYIVFTKCIGLKYLSYCRSIT